MNAWSGHDRGLAALSADLVPHGRGVDSAIRGMRDALDIISAMAEHPSSLSRETFRRVVEHARATHNDTYSEAFEHFMWGAIEELRHATAVAS